MRLSREGWYEMVNRYDVVFNYVYEDSETVSVVAADEQEAERLAEGDREGPNYAWDHAAVTVDEVYSVHEVETDIDESESE